MVNGGRPWQVMAPEEVLAELQTSPAGLVEQEVAARRQRYGENALARHETEKPWFVFWRQVNTPIGWLLIIAGCMAIAIGRVADSIVVFGAVLINALIGFVQEIRADRTVAALTALVPRSATVIRDGRAVAIAVEELVPGDIVTLQSGDQVPADLRLLRSKGLLVDESALTGESVPVGKRIEAVDEEATLGDRFCMAYSGTLAVQGTATGVVVATGGATELGRINALLNQASSLETPLTRQLTRVSGWITLVVAVVVVVLLAFGIFVKGAPVGESLLVAVALAAAAIPEGLPAVITIALAIGVRRMASRNAVVRYLPAVETLGSTTVICSDKTGTLTRNQMTVQVIWHDDAEYRFSGSGYVPLGEIEHDGHCLTECPAGLRQLLTVAVLCSDAALRREGDNWLIAGDPTEAALVVAARKAWLDEQQLRLERQRLDVVPFESEARFMATLNRFPDGSQILLKGAPEQVLPRCLLGLAELANINEALDTYGRQGLRLIACAWKETGDQEELPAASLTAGFSFAGLVGMIDPPRTEAMEAIKVCQTAGITVKMITGDHPVTAGAIGRQLGLLQQDQRVIDGWALESLSDCDLQAAATSASVFARVAPEHKIRLVRALQANGEVVAMTGDGVNDAPALKQADIGVAMGISGTAVSREAARLILVDDNFASIAAAVEEGRRVYDNLVKSIAFILPVNLGLACTLAVAVFLFPSVDVAGTKELLLVMSPSQALWINLVASITLSVPLAFEVLEPETMRRPPRRPDEPVFSGFIVLRLLLVAAVMAASASWLFLLEYFRLAGSGAISAASHAVAMAKAQTICVTAIIFTQIFYLLNCRSLRRSLLSQGIFSNPVIFVGVCLLLLLQACFCYLSPMQQLFGTAPLDAFAWVEALLAGAVVLPVIAAEKLWRRWFRHCKGLLQAGFSGKV